MREQALPGWRSDATVRSFGACLAAVLEVTVADLPDPEDRDLTGAVSLWRGALAARGLGLVQVAGADRFQWPGYSISVLADRGVAVVMFGVTAGCVLSPGEPGLVGHELGDLTVGSGWVVAPLDPGEVTVPARRRVAAGGSVVAIAIAPCKGDAMRTVESATAIAGRGLVGDRYAAGAGTFTPADPTTPGFQLTLVEAEAVEGLAPHHQLRPVSARRNVVTRGVDLDSLIGRRFRIGDEVRCLGIRRCEPCARLEQLTTPGVLRGLIHRGGLRADILVGGTIAPGMPVAPEG
ncbi:MAG: MOSC domain-containing protein [Kineosporiaceae bacterium]